MRTVLDTLKLTEILIACDDFWQQFQHYLLQQGYESEARPRQMCASEITPLVVCHNRRKRQNKTFQHLARTGKTSLGWFFGFKRPAVINQKGQLVVFRFTAGNVADNNAGLLEKLTSRRKGFLYGDKGYLTQLAAKFQERGLEIIPKYWKNMGLQALSDKKHYYLKQCGRIETVFDCLKNWCAIDHTRHRSPVNFLVNVWAALIAYSFFDQFPAITPCREKLTVATDIAII